MNFCCCVSLILYSFTFLPFFPFAFFFSPRIYGFNLLPPLNLLLRCPLNVDWWLWMSCKQKWQEKKKVLRSIQKGKNRRFHIGLHGVERILCHLSFHNINSISIELKSGYFCFKLINIYLYIYLHILFTFTYIVYIYIYCLHLHISFTFKYIYLHLHILFFTFFTSPSESLACCSGCSVCLWGDHFVPGGKRGRRRMENKAIITITLSGAKKYDKNSSNLVRHRIIPKKIKCTHCRIVPSYSLFPCQPTVVVVVAVVACMGTI